MEISKLKMLLKSISCWFHLSSRENIYFEPAQKYYKKIDEIPKFLKPVLDVIVDAEIASDESLQKAFVGLSHSVDELRELFESWHALMSKVYFVLRVESLVAKVQTLCMEIFGLLKCSDSSLPVELTSASLELCLQKTKHMGSEEASAVITKAITDLVEGFEPNSDCLTKVKDCLSLRSNQEILIEAVALEKLKENAEQAGKNDEVDYIDQMIALVMHMHECIVLLKQSDSCNAVSIPADFCCPLSLELMTDPVIVASGQTYERAYIYEWLDLGLTVCPKTWQILAHTNLIPNYTVKALIANWCESNNVKLPDHMKSINVKQPSLLKLAEFGALQDPHIALSRTQQSTSLDSTHSTGSPGNNFSSVTHHEGSSHIRSSSTGSFSGVAGSSHELVTGRVSLGRSGDISVNSGDRSSDLGGQLSVSPSGKEFLGVAGTDEPSFRGHHRTISEPSTYSNAKFSHRRPSDSNEVSSQVTAYSSDALGELTSEPNPAATLSTSQKDPELSSHARFRTQVLWLRPSERFVSRNVSSATSQTRADLSGVETQVRKLVEDLQSISLEAQRDASAEIRLLAKHNMDNRILIANCGAIPLLVDLLHSADTKIQEYAVTALLNLSISDNNKIAIANSNAIAPLIHVLETGSPDAKENSAATLYSLSVVEDNKIKIGRSGAVQPLVDLLGNGTPQGKKDAATALFNLSIFHENKARIVQAGAVKYLVELMDPAAGMVDKAVAVLSNLSTIQEGRAAIGQEGGIRVLVEVVELGSARGKENAAAALLQLCSNSNKFCNIVLQEGAVPPLVALSQSGTPRAKEKAQAILNYFRNQRHNNGGRG